VVRVFPASWWSDQIRARGSEGIRTRSIPQGGTGDQTVRRLADSLALVPAYSLKISAGGRGERPKLSGKKGAVPAPPRKSTALSPLGERVVRRRRFHRPERAG
jgi:hypothetical protein